MTLDNASDMEDNTPAETPLRGPVEINAARNKYRLDIPFSHLDVWENDADAFLSSAQSLARGGTGSWYEQSPRVETDGIGDELDPEKP